jgi:cysteine desulfurase
MLLRQVVLLNRAMRRIYLDNNATSRTDPDVVAAMLPYFTECYGNAASQHGAGSAAAAAMHDARRRVRELLGAAGEEEIVFTSGGTEANNTALMQACECGGRDEAIVSAVEHPAVLAICRMLETRRGIKVHRIAVDENGRLDLDAYAAALGPKTALVSMMWANNETGTVFPVETLAEMAHRAGALFHTDAVQAAGKISIALAGTCIDLLSLSAHKFHGPKGVGALYVRKGMKFTSFILGGRQQRGRRGGTENVPGAVGLGKAAELAACRMAADNAIISGLRDAFEALVLQTIGGCRIVGDGASRLSNTSCLAFDGVDGEEIAVRLDRAGICVSTGSACASGAMEPSHVVRAMKLPFACIGGVVRFSFGRENTAADVDAVMAKLPGIVAAARAASSPIAARCR